VQEPVDTTFEKEVVGLFALEAREWLAQIHSALKRLSEGPNGAAKPKLYGIMLQGLTNLARSAATVHLTSIEEMALKLLPTLHDVGRQDPRAMAAALATLQAGLQRISVAVRQAEGIPPAEERSESFEVPTPPAPKAEPPVTSMRMTSGTSLLTALRDLQHVRSRSVQPARDVLDAVVFRAEQKGADVTIDGIRRILDELDRMDEQFVDEVARRIPVVSRQLADLRKQGTTDFVTVAQLAPVIDQVEALHHASEAVQAGMITMFLQGLRAFLMVAAYRKTTSLAQRLAAVESRIQALLPMAEQWVSIGRVERAAIADILPVG
jgi:DNA-binding transcriptional MerR regulator